MKRAYKQTYKMINKFQYKSRIKMIFLKKKKLNLKFLKKEQKRILKKKIQSI